MAHWSDRYGRLIEITSDGTDAYAYHEGRQVGHIETTGQREIDRGAWWPPKITGMNVDDDFRCAGIGLKMIEELYKEAGEQLEPADKNIGIGKVNALTDEGLRLTERAQEKGYVLPFENETDDLERGW